jgi:hypothetical protein
MEKPPLHIGDDLAGVPLVPEPIELLSDVPELDDEVARQVLRLNFTPLFAPEPEQRGFVVAHDDPGVRAADESAAVGRIESRTHATLPRSSAIGAICA